MPAGASVSGAAAGGAGAAMASALLAGALVPQPIASNAPSSRCVHALALLDMLEETARRGVTYSSASRFLQGNDPLRTPGSARAEFSVPERSRRAMTSRSSGESRGSKAEARTQAEDRALRAPSLAEGHGVEARLPAHVQQAEAV